jgi:hypothetical protein
MRRAPPHVRPPLHAAAPETPTGAASRSLSSRARQAPKMPVLRPNQDHVVTLERRLGPNRVAAITQTQPRRRHVAPEITRPLSDTTSHAALRPPRDRFRLPAGISFDERFDHGGRRGREPLCHGGSREVALLLPRGAVVRSRGYCFQSKESPAGSAAAVANRSRWCGRPGHRFRRTRPSALARILQAPAPPLAGKQGCRDDATRRLMVDAMDMRTFDCD